MEEVILVIHLFLAIAIIGLVLLQRSEGGGLGIGGGGGGLGGVASAKSMNNFLTKATTLCAIAFFGTSLLLGVLAARNTSTSSILDQLEDTTAPVAAAEQEQEITITIDEDGAVKASDPPAAPIAE